jgi:hypothetical protein
MVGVLFESKTSAGPLESLLPVNAAKLRLREGLVFLPPSWGI